MGNCQTPALPNLGRRPEDRLSVHQGPARLQAAAGPAGLELLARPERAGVQVGPGHRQGRSQLRRPSRGSDMCPWSRLSTWLALKQRGPGLPRMLALWVTAVRGPRGPHTQAGLRRPALGLTALMALTEMMAR